MRVRAKALTQAMSCLLLVVGLFVVGVYAASEWKLNRKYEVALEQPPAMATPNLAQGERMARIIGCWAGCHGTTGEGGIEEVPGIRRITAPTLSQVIPTYSDAELFRLILHGVKRDGRSAIGMSSYVFWAVGDEDIANVIHFLRQQDSVEPVPRELNIPFLSRLGLLLGKWQVSAEQVDTSRPRWGNAPRETSYQRGRYLASIVCAECHGVDYRGDPLEGGPSLAVLAAYNEDEFATLMKTAIARSGRLVERMDWLREVGFTDQDVSDLYTFFTR